MFWISTLWCILVQLLHYILKIFILNDVGYLVLLDICLYKLFGLLCNLLAFLMSNYFPKRPSSALLHTLSKLYNVPVRFVPSPILKLCIGLFAVAEVWLLLNIGWIVLFFQFYLQSSCLRKAKKAGVHIIHLFLIKSFESVKKFHRGSSYYIFKFVKLLKCWRFSSRYG